MAKAELFLDSSALVAGVISATGGARVRLLLGEVGHISVLASEQVVAMSEHWPERRPAL